ncbi:MAG TPA: hypothetical protein VJS38_09110 [Phenylobacterium sp.]|uniref:hypothetical protein n=1 Tax=Phenylobacterium sp. TaxID=1871053 RepID=UPI002B49D356|nr:hypothetical protein [Phenylobacterium sp.]HKR88322.1 hypothetical protein [Phenylobacterium sp.]
MSRPTPARALSLASLAAVAMALAGCGKTGELQRPPPLFGPARAPAEQGRGTYDPSRPINTVDPRDEAINPGASRSSPIQGTSPNSTASPAPDAAPSQ